MNVATFTQTALAEYETPQGQPQLRRTWNPYRLCWQTVNAVDIGRAPAGTLWPSDTAPIASELTGKQSRGHKLPPPPVIAPPISLEHQPGARVEATLAWLRQHGKPAPCTEIAAATGCTPNTLYGCVIANPELFVRMGKRLNAALWGLVEWL